MAIYPSRPSAGLFRNKALQEVGDWDERLGNYFEDTAMLAKVQAANSMYVCPNPTMLYRTGQPGSLSRRLVNREGWQTLDRIALAYEGLPQLAPEPPFPTPKIGDMSIFG
ncbi:glycosyltransferase family 2 protein [Kocuria sp. LHG3120]|uniref:glycosyltransferase family 2 protein n=1 Tax=Kocuria sp. LHG3120 TaxID=2804590 RepID=UPI003CE6AE96